MKRLLLTTSIALLSIGLHAQVGINTESPTVTLEIARESSAPADKAQGVLFPKMTTAERNQMKNVPTGTVIYNTTKNCIDYYDGTYWQCSDGSKKELPPGSGAIATLGAIDPLRWVALEYNGTYYSFPQNGIAPNATISVSIPYSNATNRLYYGYYEQTFTLPDKDGNLKDFKLSYPAGTLSNGSGTITATLTNISGSTYYPKAQPIDGQWKDLANVQVTLNGTSATLYQIQAIGGIPDRGFGKTTREYVGYGANVKEHEFIYFPVRVKIGTYDKVWLNNNLGATYANLNSSHFNPTQQATSHADYKAYGSLFQWQRKADGHEFITYSGASNGTPKEGTTSSLASSWTNAGTDKFITNYSSDYSWVSNSVNNAGPFNLWRANGSNNPCPVGYHVPTKAEWVAYHKAVTGSETELTNGTFWDAFNANLLRLPAAGNRFTSDGSLHHQSFSGIYWSSEFANYDFYRGFFYFSSSNSNPIRNGNPANGLSCRCIQD